MIYVPLFVNDAVCVAIFIQEVQEFIVCFFMGSKTFWHNENQSETLTKVYPKVSQGCLTASLYPQISSGSCCGEWKQFQIC